MEPEKLCVNRDESKRYDAEFDHINIALQAMNIQHRMHQQSIINLMDRMDAVEKVLSDYIDEVDDKDEDESSSEDRHSECSSCKKESHMEIDYIIKKELKRLIQDINALSESCEKLAKN